MKKINWYVKRFKKMPFQEFPYRLTQAIHKRIDKFSSHIFPPLDNILTCRFSDICNSVVFREYDDTIIPFSEHESLIKETDDILRHRFDIFGVTADFGEPLNFHLDPKTSNTWPLKFWNDIDYRDGVTIGGIKFAWELNRLHHWPKLALAYVVSRDEKYFNEFLAQLKSWLEANPYPFGINWISGIEMGIRLVNLYYALRIFAKSDIPIEYRSCLAQFVYIHATHLFRYPSKFSSCGNHALAEALGLYVAGLAFPCFKDAEKWKSFGKQVLDREVERQIYPDGSSFEHSIPYLQFVADHYVVYYFLSREYGQQIADSVEHRMEKVFDFLAGVVDANGNIPLIGDDDDGYLLKLWFGEHNNFLSLLSMGSLIFNRPEWVHPKAILDTKIRVLMSRSVEDDWRELSSRRIWSLNACLFQDAGLSVFAVERHDEEIKLVFNHGPLGMNPSAGHGHADALSFWLSVNGEPVFIDPGTYLYHSGKQWRAYFRSTVAHNTIEVDGQDQAEQVADFMFNEFYQVFSDGLIENEEIIMCKARHDGYCRLNDPVTHNRNIIFGKKNNSFIIKDVVSCAESHRIRLLFHFHPNIVVEKLVENSYQLLSTKSALKLTIENDFDCRMIKGSMEPLLGWFSACFNHLEKTTTLECVREIKGTTKFRSVVTVL